jgi:hypothetical protein
VHYGVPVALVAGDVAVVELPLALQVSGGMGIYQ